MKLHVPICSDLKGFCRVFSSSPATCCILSRLVESRTPPMQPEPSLGTSSLSTTEQGFPRESLRGRPLLGVSQYHYGANWSVHCRICHIPNRRNEGSQYFETRIAVDWLFSPAVMNETGWSWLSVTHVIPRPSDCDCLISHKSVHLVTRLDLSLHLLHRTWMPPAQTAICGIAYGLSSCSVVLFVHPHSWPLCFPDRCTCAILVGSADLYQAASKGYAKGILKTVLRSLLRPLNITWC